jgi:hypothetical protein
MEEKWHSGAVVHRVVPQLVAGEIVQEAGVLDLGLGVAGAGLEEEAVAEHQLGLGELRGARQVLLQMAQGHAGLVELALLHLLVGRGHQFGGGHALVHGFRFLAAQAQARQGGGEGEGGEDALHADSGDSTSDMAGRCKGSWGRVPGQEQPLEPGFGQGLGLGPAAVVEDLVEGSRAGGGVPGARAGRRTRAILGSVRIHHGVGRRTPAGGWGGPVRGPGTGSPPGPRRGRPRRPPWPSGGRGDRPRSAGRGPDPSRPRSCPHASWMGRWGMNQRRSRDRITSSLELERRVTAGLDRIRPSRVSACQSRVSRATRPPKLWPSTTWGQTGRGGMGTPSTTRAVAPVRSASWRAPGAGRGRSPPRRPGCPPHRPGCRRTAEAPVIHAGDGPAQVVQPAGRVPVALAVLAVAVGNHHPAPGAGVLPAGPGQGHAPMAGQDPTERGLQVGGDHGDEYLGIHQNSVGLESRGLL